MDPIFLGTAAAFGLASAAGLNTTLPLFLVGVVARLGLLTLTPPFDALESDVALIGLGVLAALEVIADKIPGADSAVHAFQWPLTLAAGAILFASQQSMVKDVSPGLAILVGVLTAGGVHGLRSLVRPAVNLGTMGLGGPVISGLEDFAAVGLTITSLFAPLFAIAFVAVIVALGIRVLQRRRDGRAAPTGSNLPAGGPRHRGWGTRIRGRSRPGALRTAHSRC